MAVGRCRQLRERPGARCLRLQAEVLQREVGRLGAENSRLHANLLREADAQQAQEAGTHQRAKQAEARAADLAFAKEQALERAAALERERDGLRAKVRDLLSFGQQHAGGGWAGARWGALGCPTALAIPCGASATAQHSPSSVLPCAPRSSPSFPPRTAAAAPLSQRPTTSACLAAAAALSSSSLLGRPSPADELELKAAYSSFSMTAPLEPRPAPAAAAKTSRGAISLIKAADSRILALEAEVRRREEAQQALGAQVQQAKVGAAHVLGRAQGGSSGTRRRTRQFACPRGASPPCHHCG